MRTKQKHKHADLITEWAQGAEIEVYFVGQKKWGLCKKPEWNENSEYRIKKNPDIVIYANIADEVRESDFASEESLVAVCGLFGTRQTESDNLKITYSGETGKLLSMKMIAQE